MQCGGTSGQLELSLLHNSMMQVSISFYKYLFLNKLFNLLITLLVPI